MVALLLVAAAVVVGAVAVRLTHRTPRTAPGRHRAVRPPLDPPGAGLHAQWAAALEALDPVHIPAQRGGEDR